MSTTGVVLSVDVERYGDTLMAATATTDTVLQVSDVVDFADEDDFAAGPQWLVIGDSEPMQYVAVDDDNDTVTLALAVGAVYEAGEPVRMWDAAADSEVVSHVAWVELDEADDNDQPVPAEVRHDAMIFFGLADLSALIGAHVVIEEDDEDPETWHVSSVIGREPKITSESLSLPYLAQFMTADLSLASGFMQPITGLGVRAVDPHVFGRRVIAGGTDEGWIECPVTGLIRVVVTGSFAANTTGSRNIQIVHRHVDLTTTVERRINVAAATSGAATRMQVFKEFPVAAGEWVRGEAYQDSGAALTLMGGSHEYTAVEISWVGVSS